MEVPNFPKGFDSWHKTYFEVVEVLVYKRALDGERQGEGFEEALDQSATDEEYRLALELTNKYEEETKGKEREGTLFDDIEEFVWRELNKG